MKSIVVEEKDVQLEDSSVELFLPFDHPRPAQIINNKSYHFIISSDLTKDKNILDSIGDFDLSLFSMTLFKVLLTRYSNEEDICIGARMAKQNDVKVIRTYLQSNITFIDALEKVKNVVFKTKRSSGMTYEDLTHERSKGKYPLFRVYMEHEHVELEDYVEQSLVDIDLYLRITQTNNMLSGTFFFSADLFEEETIVRMAKHFNNIRRSVLANFDIPILQIPLLTSDERHQLLVEWNKPTTIYPRNSSITELFEEQVKLYPNNIAVILADRHVTYKELNNKANQIANYLRALGLAEGQLVGICLERSPEMIASFLGVLKAGGAYVPIDLSYPEERITYMLHDSQASFIISTESIVEELSVGDSVIIYLDKESDEISAQSNKNIHYDSADHLAYVMYTSGSTGNPKGVEMVHRGISRLVKNTKYVNLGPNEVILNRASIAFDVSAFEIYGSLLNGGRLVLINSFKPTFEAIAKAIKVNAVTILRVGPDMLNVLIEDYRNDLNSLKQVLCGGEVFPVWLAGKFLKVFDDCTLINSYGPTENAVNTSCYQIKGIAPDQTSIPIGRPICNDHVYILDENMEPVPMGAIGELYMAGDGLARGYLDKPDLTKQVFLMNPFSSESSIMYKSGDLVRYRSDGNIEFVGRKDDQVKVRGLRIELGEIETIIGQRQGIRQVVANMVKGPQGTNELAAYIIMDKGVTFDQQSLRSYLQDKLPGGMIPTFFVELDIIPVTPVGKIDRKSLPTPTVSASKNIAAPRNETERLLIEIWEDVLKVQPIGIKDRYYELGGNSLLAMQLFSRIEKEFNKSLPVSIIFQEDTIEKLAKYLSTKDVIIDTTLVPIQPHGANPPLFCVHGGGGEVLVYKELAVELGNDQPLYGLRYTNDQNNDQANVEMLATKYINALKDIQKRGPYNILGYCYGGAIAYEMAQQLLAEGEEVSLLAILNFANPKQNRVEVRNEVNYNQVIKNNIKKLFNMPLKQRVSFFKDKVINAIKLVNPSQDEQVIVDDVTKARIALGKAINQYKPKPYSGNLMLIRANNYQASDENLGWKVSKENYITEYFIEAEHEELLKGSSVKQVVHYLKDKISTK